MASTKTPESHLVYNNETRLDSTRLECIRSPRRMICASLNIRRSNNYEDCRF